MLAVTRQQYGSPKQIEIVEMPAPDPKPREVLVRVYYTSVNRTDCGVLTGLPRVFRLFIGWSKPKRPILGTDFAGEVVAVGKSVKRFQPGDRVWGINDEGLSSQAEYVVLSEKAAIATLPEGIDYPTAAASAEGPHYAYHMIRALHPQPGQRALVYGASGAIGSAMVQLLNYLNVHTVAVAGTDTLDRVATLGATRLIDYQTEDLFQLGLAPFDFVIDAVGKRRFSDFKPLLQQRGVYVSTELGPNAENLYLPLLTYLRGGRRVIFPIPGRASRSLSFMHNLLEKGLYRPLIDRSYPVREVAEAYRYVASGQKVGNVLLDLRDPAVEQWRQAKGVK